MNPTPEQAAIVSAAKRLDAGQILSINAYAGTGKTTTNTMIAAAMPGTKFIYICFNKDMAEAAREKFPSHVECRTAHSLAYASTGLRYKRKLGPVRGYVVARLMRCDDSDARAATAAINNFLCSEDSAITFDHVRAACGEMSHEIHSLATRIWRRMSDPADVEMPMPHDGYLKLFVMGKPDLPGVEVVLVDEAQDLNPVLLQLLLQLAATGKRIVFVGDSHQSIYGFRLAVDAMSKVAGLASAKLSLTESWRFPQAVADSASKVLSTFKGDSVRLIGRGSGIAPALRVTHCTLSRTNVKLIQEAHGYLCAKRGKKIHFSATRPDNGWNPFDSYRFQEILDAYALYSGSGKVMSPHLLRFRSYSELASLARGADEDGADADPELSPLCDFVDKYSHETPGLLRSLQEASVGPDDANHHFSTAHRAKGKEWHRVKLTDDFLPLDDKDKLAEKKEKLTVREFKEEVNLLYVAITRGKVNFTPPLNCANFFSLHQPSTSLS